MRSVALLLTILSLVGSSITAQPTADSTDKHSNKSAWRHKLQESHLKLPKGRFHELRTSFLLLERLASHLPAHVHQQELTAFLSQVSELLGFPVTSPGEAKAILHFFTNEAAAGATRASGFILFVNFLMLIAGLAILVSFMYVLRDWVMPFFGRFGHILRKILELPYAIKRWLFLAAALALLPVALRFPGYSRPYAGLFETFLLALAVRYFIDSLEDRADPEFFVNADKISRNMVSFSVFFVMAILFDSDLIGFFTVMHFYFSAGFFEGPSGRGWFFGFDERSRLGWMVFISGLLLLAYASLTLSGIQRRALQVFETGIFFCSTFTHFIMLTVALFKYSGSLGVHIHMVISSLACFLFGSLSPDLTILRGIGTTFFVLYLMERLGSVNWGKFWSLGMFVGGLLVFGYASLLRSYWTYFI